MSGYAGPCAPPSATGATARGILHCRGPGPQAIGGAGDSQPRRQPPDAQQAEPRTPDSQHRGMGQALHTKHKTLRQDTTEQETTGPGHRIRNTTHRAGTPVNRSPVAQDIAHTSQSTKRAHRRRGAKRPRTPHARHAVHGTSTPVNRSQVAQDSAHATQHTEQAHWSPVAQDTAHATQSTEPTRL